MPTAQERRAAIAAATLAARKQAIAARETRAAAVQDVYSRAGKEIGDWLRQHAGPDGIVPREQLPAWDLFLTDLLRRMSEQWTQALTEGLAEAAAYGASMTAIGSDSVAARTLQQLRAHVGADGLQLSDRIWRVNAGTKHRIEGVIRGAIERGATARDAARALLGQGRGVSAEIALQIRAATAEPLAESLTDNLLRGEGNPMRNALRVMRTEMNRAFTESFVTSVFAHPDVAAVKFNLSPAHPRPDICDMYASANLHGMGAGVYPQGAHPYPAHPETLSYLTVVFLDEITDQDRAGQQSMTDWLRQQGGPTQDAVLGKNKGDAFRAGQLGQNDLMTPWRILKPRLGAPA